MAGHAALEVRGLRHQYGSRVALDGIDLSVQPGEIFGLLGPNGGGKTTLFRIAATRLHPTGGAVAVFGDDVTRDPARVRRRLGVVFQAPALDRRLTVRENVTHYGHLFGLHGASLREAVDRVLARVRLTDRAGDLVMTLSGGLARRAEIGRALLTRPALLLLDEPTTGLDPGVREEIWADLRSLVAEGQTTIVLTTHLLDEAAGCDRIAILDAGRIVISGRPDALTASVGGDIITIDAADADADGLASRVAERFGLTPRVVEGAIHIEQPRAHEWISRIVEAFPGEIRSIRFSRPTLQDVFLAHTGRRFE
jgi:ABC-2 type transport system ATP-binding protein